MKFKIAVGEVEKHEVEYHHNQLIGSLLIKVDEKVVHHSRRLINEPVREIHQFVVGQMERSEVRIEKLRKQLFGTRNNVYVGNRLVHVFEGL